MVIVAAATAIIFTLATPGRERIRYDEVTSAAMAPAQEALIGYAAASEVRPGQLPCPDRDNDGLADAWDVATGECLNGYVGRLPWKTLGLAEPRDGAGELLWYAVTRDYARNPALCSPPCPLNPNTAGDFSINGTAANGIYVAIVFSPGESLGNQLRLVDPNAVSNYLDGANASGGPTFVMGATTPAFNDRLLAITNDALFNVVNRRVAKEVVVALDVYRGATGYLPRASSFADENCDPNLIQGRLPEVLETCESSRTTLINILGIEIITSTTPMATWASVTQLATWRAWYFDNEWNTVTFYAVSEGCSAPAQGSAGSLLGILNQRRADCANLSLLNLGSLLSILGILPSGQPETPVRVTTANTDTLAVVLVSGRKLSGSPPCAAATECFQDTADTENVDGDKEFTRPPRYPASNDKMAGLCPAGSPCQLDNCPSAPGVPCAFVH